MPDPLTDAQLRQLGSYMHPDEDTEYVQGWLQSMATELLDHRHGASASLDAARSARDEAVTLASNLAAVAKWQTELSDEWRRRVMEAEDARGGVNATIVRTGRVIAKRNATIKALHAQIEEMRRDETTARLIRDLTDPDGCDFDHHGGCQAHGYLDLEPGELCPHEEAKRWLAERAPGEELGTDGE